MDIKAEKKQIIEEIRNVNDEVVLLMLKRLLNLPDVAQYHEPTVEDALQEYRSCKCDFQEWDSVRSGL